MENIKRTTSRAIILLAVGRGSYRHRFKRYNKGEWSRAIKESEDLIKENRVDCVELYDADLGYTFTLEKESE